MITIQTPKYTLQVKYDRGLKGLLEKDIEKDRLNKFTGEAVIRIYTQPLPNPEEAEQNIQREFDEFNWKVPDHFHKRGKLKNGLEYIILGAMTYVLDNDGSPLFPSFHKAISIGPNSYAVTFGHERYFRIDVVNSQ